MSSLLDVTITFDSLMSAEKALNGLPNRRPFIVSSFPSESHSEASDADAAAAEASTIRFDAEYNRKLCTEGPVETIKTCWRAAAAASTSVSVIPTGIA